MQKTDQVKCILCAEVPGIAFPADETWAVVV